MTYSCHLPHPHLSRYIRFYWVLESDAPYVHRATADGCAELVFHVNGDFVGADASGVFVDAAPATLRGPASQYSRYSCDSSFSIFGVYIYPYALRHLFNIPANVLGNTEHSLSTILGANGNALTEKLQEARDLAARIKVVEHYFFSALRKHESTDFERAEWMIQQVINCRGRLSIGELAAESFLSTRQLERQFVSAAGFTPKLYTRIIRFQSAAAQYGTELSMTQLAYECGYYDQAHFIHDFRQFSGFTPRQYFSGLSEGTAWRDV